MDKIDRLLDAIEHPDLYSGKEIEAMLSDAEVREVYDLLDKTKSTLTPIPAPDIDAEWDAFRKSHPANFPVSPHTPRRGSFRLLNLFTRNIAASIAIGVVSLAAVAAVVGVSVNYVIRQKTEPTPTEAIAVVKENVAPDDTIVVAEETSATTPETIIFDNEPLETIATRIAGYYGYNAEFSTDTPKTLRLYFRWNQAQTLDEIVESLNNFEQIHISVKEKTIKID